MVDVHTNIYSVYCDPYEIDLEYVEKRDINGILQTKSLSITAVCQKKFHIWREILSDDSDYSSSGKKNVD